MSVRLISFLWLSARAARRPAATRKDLFLAYPALIPQRVLRASEPYRATIGRPAEAGLEFRCVRRTACLQQNVAKPEYNLGNRCFKRGYLCERLFPIHISKSYSGLLYRSPVP